MEVLTIANLKDLVSIITSILLVYVALQGLRTWRKQLIGNTEYELARKLLRAIYKTRNAISIVRNPAIFLGELSAALKESGIEEYNQFDPKMHRKGDEAVYERRWKHVREAISEFNIEAIEAEALWGVSISYLLVEFRKSVNKLNWALGIHLDEKEGIPADLASEVHDIIYGREDLTGSDSKTDYGEELAVAISNLEKYLKPKLRL